MLDGWRRRLTDIQRDTYALYYACRDRRVPWFVKALGIAVAAYALSPVDLLPDFIPVVGALDDLLIIPAGLCLVSRMIPPAILAEHRSRAVEAMTGPSARLTTAVVAATWLVLLGGAVVLIAR